jgi:S1-C subfamily serine protease
MGQVCRRLARSGLVGLALPALAQDPAPPAPAPAAAAEDFYQRPKQVLSAQEQEAIEINRKLATPRPTTRRAPLSPAEAARAAVFKNARNSVVYIDSLTQKWVIKEKGTGNIYAMPPASGTGFVWDNYGHIVTNHHVITIDDPQTGMPKAEAEDLQVTLTDGKTYKAVVIGRSLAQDIAVLQVFAPLDRMKPLFLGTSADLQVGQDVLAIGNPFGLDHSLTAGVVSALRRDIPGGFGTHIRDAIQTDAAVNPGNSGGPLLDRTGRLIGMNTAIRSNTGNSAGIGLAIPVDTLNKVVPVLIARGQLQRPELGFTSLTAGMTAILGSPGVAIGIVDPGGLAALAGFRGLSFREGHAFPPEPKDYILGDVIIGFAGTPIDSETQLMDLLELEPPDADLPFTILRNGKQLRLTIHPNAPKPSAPTQST